MHTSHATSGTAPHATLSGGSANWPLHNDEHHSPAPAAGLGAEATDATSRAADAGARDLSRLEQEISGLRRRLLTQPAIEQAKGLLIGCYGIDADTAFAVLVRWSQHSNIKLHLLAAGLVAAAGDSSGQPHAALQRFIDERLNADDNSSAGSASTSK